MLPLSHCFWYSDPDKNPTLLCDSDVSWASIQHYLRDFRWDVLKYEKDCCQVEAYSSFGEWLRARRKALDLTQFDLAQKAGCAEDTIGRIEAGTRRPSRQVAALLADALSVPPQSHADFVRFAREGGSAAGLWRAEDPGDVGDVTERRPSSPAEPTKALSAAWAPYLSSLPQAPTPLIGREDELAAAARLLRSGQARLLTLSGPPGVGKTRLALALAATLTPAFPDGICFVPLAPLRDPTLLTITVSHALGLSDNRGGPQAARLIDFLRQKRLLLVLDNFEHLVVATPQVAEWLATSPHLQLLVTSRSALQIRGERLFPVPTLPVPPISGTPDKSSQAAVPPQSAEAATYPSVALFVERVQAGDPGFKLTASNSQVVVELCRRMEGLPLAIELTAARSARLAPELVLSRLERRLDVVTKGPRDLPDHQRTLRTAIAWSYDLLGEPERLLFARMSVFAGGATLDALEAVCNAHDDLQGSGPGESGLADALEGLLQQSLVYGARAEGEEDFQAGRRFNMLEMLREYATEKLAEMRGELGAKTMAHYHAEYYLAMAEAAELQKWSAEQELWLNRLERDHDNLRAAIEWALDNGQIEMAGALCGALWNFWRVRGYISEGRNWLDKVLAHTSDLSPRTLARILNGAGVLTRSQGDHRAAVSLHERSVAIFRELDDKHGLADSLNNLGVDLHNIDQPDRAEAVYQESLQIWMSLGDEVGSSKPMHNLGLIAQARRDYERAASLYRESLEIERAHGDRAGMCFCLYNLGVVFTLLSGAVGNDTSRDETLEEAERCFTEGLDMARELGYKMMTAMCLIKLGELSLQPGDEERLTKAQALFEEGLAMHKELGDKGSIAYTLNDLGYAALLHKDWATARSLFTECLRLSQAIEARGYIAMNLTALAATEGAEALASSNRVAAERSARRAIQLSAASRAIFDPNLIPAKVRFHEETFNAVSCMLSRDELEELQALGTLMSINEAIDFAMDE